jgi:hypothetical protein
MSSLMVKIIFNVIVGEYPHLFPCYTYTQKIEDEKWEHQNKSFSSVKEVAKTINYVLRRKTCKDYQILSDLEIPEIIQIGGDFSRGEGILLNPYIRELKEKEKSQLARRLSKLQHPSLK